MEKTESGLAIYALLTDRTGLQVKVRRSYGDPPRVVIDTTEPGNPTPQRLVPELDPAMAKQVAEALLQFCRRVAVHDDAALPKKQIEVVESEQDRNNRQLLSAIHS